MSSNDIQVLQLIRNTIDSLTISGVENWNKVLGCISAIDNLITNKDDNEVPNDTTE